MNIQSQLEWTFGTSAIFSKNHGEGCDFENFSVDRVDNQLWFGIKYVKIEWFNEEIDFFQTLSWLDYLIDLTKGAVTF